MDNLRASISYNSDTGEFTWIKPYSRKIKPGDVAGSYSKSGYRVISVNKKKYLAHRLAFLYMTGEVPDFVDHINGVKDDNRWYNLRPATKSQNALNSRTHRDSKSGIKGVVWIESRGKWLSRVTINGRLVISKEFHSFDEAKIYAEKARESAHGEFFRHG